MKITRNQLIEGLRKMKGAKIISLTADTDARFTKKSGYKGTRKKAKVSGFIGFTYESVMNNKLEKQGEERDFKSQETWGTHEEGLIENHGKYYLQLLVKNTKAEYILNENLVTEDVSDLIKTDDGLKYRRYGIDSIKSIKIGGEEYEID